VDLRPDERGQYYLLSVSANDRTGLLYSIANVLAKYRINLHTAKVMTLGERVEDVFLIDGPACPSRATRSCWKPNCCRPCASDPPHRRRSGAAARLAVQSHPRRWPALRFSQGNPHD
jgi:hypothetical protein